MEPRPCSTANRKPDLTRAGRSPRKYRSSLTLDNRVHNWTELANHLHQLMKNIEQEEKLLEVLMKHNKVINWILTDLPRINPSICTHKILLEEET
ncbi:hypothetical protein CR513_06966, partial [Mucuna pruriens]